MPKGATSKYLAKLLAIKEEMEILDLSNLHLDINHVKDVCQLILKHCDTLVAITLANNDLGKCMHRILQFCRVCPKLSAIDLVDNNIDDENVWQFLGSMILKMPNLVDIYIGARLITKPVGKHAYYDLDLKRSAMRANTVHDDLAWYVDGHYATGFNEIKMGDLLFLQDTIIQRHADNNPINELYLVSEMRTSLVITKDHWVYSYDRSVNPLTRTYHPQDYDSDEKCKDFAFRFVVPIYLQSYSP